MGRRVTVGILPGGIGQLSIDANTVTTVETDADLTLDADGAGIIFASKTVNITAGDLIIDNQGDVRFKEQSGNGSNYVAVQAPAALASNYTITLPNAVATRDKSVLTSDTSGNTSWEPPKTFEYSVQSTSFSAAAFGGYFINTSAGGVTVTLPSSPVIGDTIRFFDVAKTFDTNNLTISRNGKLIQGDAANMTVDTEGAAFELVFSNDTYGWRIFSI
jgi:hypothetical protein